MAGLLADPDRSRARSRLKERGVLELLPRLRERATCRGFLITAEQLVDVLADPRLTLGGCSAGRLVGWDVPEGSWPVEAYVPEHQLAELVEQYALEREEQSPDLLLRSVPEPWPVPPHTRVAPSLVTALDLSESAHPELAAIGTTRLEELARDVEPDWRQRPPRRRPVRPAVPSESAPAGNSLRKRSGITDELWDDRAEADAEQLVGLLFVAAEPLKRSEITEVLKDRSGAIAEDPRFGGCGRPSFLVTTELFLRRFGFGSLTDLPPRPSPNEISGGGVQGLLRIGPTERDNQPTGRTSGYGD